MTTDYIGATDDMNTTVKAAWDAACASLSITKQKLFYQGVVKAGAAEIGKADEYWARVTYNTIDQGQNAVSGGPSPSAVRHKAVGVLFVQMFFPLGDKGSWRKGCRVASQVKNALRRRSSAGTVVFTRPRINELAADGDHHRLNVVADTEYDEFV